MSIKKRVKDRAKVGAGGAGGAGVGVAKATDGKVETYLRKRAASGVPVKAGVVKMMDTKKREENYKAAVAEGKVGRPKEPLIDFEAFEGLCKIQCTQIEIAAFFKRGEDTIKRQVEEHYNSLDEEGLRILDKKVPERKLDGEAITLEYKEIIKRLYSVGRISLRRAQFKTALQTENPTMQIWLGKQMLGQQDIVIVSDDTDAQQVEFDVRENLYNEENAISPIAKDAASLS